MSEREHHVRVAVVLEALDGELLRTLGCLLGGGTAIVLRFGEYRESLDVEFLVADRAGYRELRKRLVGAESLAAIARPGVELALLREVRADQYGIRTLVEVRSGARGAGQYRRLQRSGRGHTLLNPAFQPAYTSYGQSRALHVAIPRQGRTRGGGPVRCFTKRGGDARRVLHFSTERAKLLLTGRSVTRQS